MKLESTTMIDTSAALTGYSAILVYVGIRLGWWAPAGTSVLNASFGRCSRLEFWGLIAATIGIPVWLWTAG